MGKRDYINGRKKSRNRHLFSTTACPEGEGERVVLSGMRAIKVRTPGTDFFEGTGHVGDKLGGREIMKRSVLILLLMSLGILVLPVPVTGAPELVASDPECEGMDFPVLMPELWVYGYFSEAMSGPSVSSSHNPFIHGRFIGKYELGAHGVGNTSTPWGTFHFVCSRIRDGFAFYGERVFVTITDDVTSEGGESLMHGYTWSFTTAVTQGSGVFDEADTLSVAMDPLRLATADLNGDRVLDLVTANRNSNNISILMGNGDGTFGSSTEIGVGTHPERIAVADLNGDLLADLVVANRVSDDLTLLTNSGGGAFSATTLPSGGLTPSSVIAADLNSDGHQDLVVANGGSGIVSVFLSDGVGGFATPTGYAAAQAADVQVFDFDMDYDLDLAVARWYGPPSSSVSWVTVLENSGDGTFTNAGDYEVGAGASCIIAARLNDDAYPDLATVAHYENGVSLLTNNGDGTFSVSSINNLGSGPHSLSAADYDADGDFDLTVSSYYDNNVTILTNPGDGNFVDARSYSTQAGPVGMVSGDFDNDGDMDVATSNNQDNSVTVLFNNEAVTSVPEEELLPLQPYLSQNYPNPFNPSTIIEFNLPRRAHVRIEVLNLLGQRVCTLLDEPKAAGPHRVRWEGISSSGHQVSSGIYLYRLVTENTIDTRKMILLK